MKTNLKTNVRQKFSFSLVKWDGDAPENWKTIEHPEQHPKCLEVMAWELGQPAKSTYKKE